MLQKSLFALALVSLLSACAKEGSEAGGKAASASSVADAASSPTLLVAQEDLLTMQSKSMSSGPVITGSVQPSRKADLRAEVSAVVLSVLKENGDQVKRGEVLVRLDETAIRDNLMSADEAARSASQALDQAERNLNRLKTLRTSGMTSAQALDEAETRRNNAQSDLAAAKSRVAQARQQQSRTLVRAPFDGVVSDRKVSAGDTASLGKELLKVVDPGSVRFEGHVSSEHVARVKVGQAVNFRINGYPGQPFQGKVTRIEPLANEVTRQVEVLVEFAEPARPQVAGLYAEGKIETDTTAALMLPASAIVRDGDQTYAWRLKGHTLNKMALQVGTRDARTGQFEIRKGLADGDLVMRNPGAGFKDGQQVERAKEKVAMATLPRRGE